MLDLNRLVGFVYYSYSSVLFKEIKNELMKVSETFEADDVSIVQGEYCQGGGEITGVLANSKNLVNYSDFVNMLKAVIKTIGKAEINSPKIIFGIVDKLDFEIDHTFDKMEKLCCTYDYEPKLNFLVLDEHATTRNAKSKFTVIHSVSDLREEISNILQVTNGE